MTSNHPEKLDAALIRPGRVDKVIYLGYMRVPEARELLRHYFQCDDLTPLQLLRLTDIITHGTTSLPYSKQKEVKFIDACEDGEDDGYPAFQRSTFTRLTDRNGNPLPPKFTPAEMEQLCAECETVDEFLDSLQERASRFVGESELVVPGVKRQISISRTTTPHVSS